MAAAVTPRWWGGHKVLAGLVALMLAFVVAMALWASYLNSQIADIPRMDLDVYGSSGFAEGDRAGSERALNILIAGTDARDGETVPELMRDGWQPGVVRSDTIMVLHIAADRGSASLVSVPRDTWTDIPGYGAHKLNAAFSFGGPELYLETMEAFTGLRMDHVVLVGWEGLKDLSSAVGGVDVVIPQDIHDPESGYTWTAGTHRLQGDRALRYVRMRYGMPNGDFDRINRQQNFLRALFDELLSRETLVNPIRLTNSVEAIAQHLTLDASFSNSEVRDLALSLRGIERSDITFTTVPLERYDTVRGQSAVIVDVAQARRLFAAADRDRLRQFLDEEGIDPLPGVGSVT